MANRESYEIYITDVLRIIGGIDVRYYDITHENECTETAEEIISRISKGLDKLGGEGDSGSISTES